MTAPSTCLGCGCACDDIDVVLRDGLIADARNACALGAAWFGNGRAPARVLSSGREVALDDALDAAAMLLTGASRPMVYLAPDISCEAQREGVAIADWLRAALDSVTSATAMPSVLASQARGRASATLGELRNRADVLVFWGVDPGVRYPRFWSRYAPEPAGVHVGGRAARRVIAVDIGSAAGPADADLRVAVEPEDEVTTLTTLRAGDGELSAVMRSGRYVAIVADAEGAADDNGLRAEGLIALAQSLNAVTRCALSLLRSGGNRSGADACLTWQTGYPAAVDFARGFPRYRPHAGSAAAADAVLVLGAPAQVPANAFASLTGSRVAAIGPRASEGPFAGAEVVIDTAVAGIHEEGTALRMDDVPVPLRAVLSGPPRAVDVARALRTRLAGNRGAK